MEIKDLTQEQILIVFYTCGAIIFLGVGIANSVSNFINWDIMLLSYKFSSVLSNIFNYVLSWFFYSMLRDKRKEQKALNPLEEEQAEEILNNIENGN